jgi:uncharacterized RDD family membrane protein YckC/Tfp pilus assembly major pilin PilA
MFCPECGSTVADTNKFCRKCGISLSPPAPAERTPRRPPPLPTGPARVEHQGAGQADASIAPGSAAAATGATVYAGFGRRFLAFILDFVLVLVMVSFSIGFLKGFDSRLAKGAVLMIVIVPWLYKAILESSAGQATLGKRAFGIQVSCLKGERIGFWRATARVFAQVLSHLSFYIGYLMAAFTKRQQALHDLIAGTLVVRRGSSPAVIALAPPAPRGDGAAIVALCVVAGIGGVGILAAIAIPAYQEYTIRAQVVDGLNLADAYKTAAAEALASGVNASNINSGQGGTIEVNAPSAGKYVESVVVVAGNVYVTYGRDANALISGHHLTIYSIQRANGEILWVCGKAAVPPGEDLTDLRIAERQLTDLPNKYLPSSCKG